MGKKTDGKIDIFRKIPRHIVWVLELDVVFIEREGSGCIQVPEKSEMMR